MTKWLLLWVSSQLAFAGCLPVTGNRILGRDLAAADARFAALPATLTVGFAPVPGTQRIYTSADLQHIARANGIRVANFTEVCFELPMRRLTEAETSTAMRRSLPAEASLKIVEVASVDVPAGTVEFPVEGLEPSTPSSHGVQLWRGYVKYAETRRASTWARVEITVKTTAVVAAKDLPQDVPIHASALRVETWVGPLDRTAPATRIEDVVGRVPKRALRAGAPIPLTALAEAPAVHRGDSVSVVVESGLARVSFEAVAENAAHDGDIVELKNPVTGKTFRGRLDPGPKVVLVITEGHSL